MNVRSKQGPPEEPPTAFALCRKRNRGMTPAAVVSGLAVAALIATVPLMRVADRLLFGRTVSGGVCPDGKA